MRKLTLPSATAFLVLTLACKADPTSTGPGLGQLELRHETGIVRVYDQIAIQARAWDGANQLVAAPPPLEWRSENPSIATVEPYGLVTGHSVGDVRVWASAGGVEANLDISVRPALLRVVLQAGSSVMQVGQKAILVAKFLGSRVPANVAVTWESTEDDVIDVRTLTGSVLPRIEVTARSTGLARISARAAHGQGNFVFAVGSDPVADSPIEITDFHFNVTQHADDRRSIDPSLRLRVAPGRNVELIRVDVGLSGVPIVHPALCASERLMTGQYDILGVNNFPLDVDRRATWEPGEEEPSGVAVLTYRAEDGVARSIALEGWIDPWGYDWVSAARIDWQSCPN